MSRDVTIPLVRGGYAFLDRWWPGPRDTVMEVRLLGRRTLVVRGEDAARLFYDGELFSRRGAVPGAIGNPLFGRGAIHGLDGSEHQRRKAMFLTALSLEAAEQLADAVGTAWSERCESWLVTGRAAVFDEAVQVLGAAVLAWSQAPVQPPSVTALAHDLARLVDGFGSMAPSQLVTRRLARRRCETWARSVIRVSRARGPADVSTPTDLVAGAKDSSGAPLPERVAAVELLNLLRPAVAVAWFVSFAAIAIADHPELRASLSSAGDHAGRRTFAHELRRAYPFVPMLAARARVGLDIQGHPVRPGQRVLLDVWGSHHLPDRWPAPDSFQPCRFVASPPTAYDLVPQGGGDPAQGHRCPGEAATELIIQKCAQRLADLDYEIVPADRLFPMTRMPTRPPSGPLLTGITRRQGRQGHQGPRPGPHREP